MEIIARCVQIERAQRLRKSGISSVIFGHFTRISLKPLGKSTKYLSFHLSVKWNSHSKITFFYMVYLHVNVIQRKTNLAREQDVLKRIQIIDLTCQGPCEVIHGDGNGS